MERAGDAERNARAMPSRAMSRVETSALIHGPDERIDLRDLGFATRFFAELPEALLGWSGGADLASAA